jgi:hypothetical protein
MAFTSEPHLLQITFSRSGIGSPLLASGPNATPGDPIVPPKVRGVPLSEHPAQVRPFCCFGGPSRDEGAARRGRQRELSS